jgi:glutamate synthase (NADPH/NADH) large chain
MSDATQVRALVSKHHDETGSAVAAALLADWPVARARFNPHPARATTGS